MKLTPYQLFVLLSFHTGVHITNDLKKDKAIDHLTEISFISQDADKNLAPTWLGRKHIEEHTSDDS